LFTTFNFFLKKIFFSIFLLSFFLIT
jgi:hypothetical protein